MTKASNQVIRFYCQLSFAIHANVVNKHNSTEVSRNKLERTGRVTDFNKLGRKSFLFVATRRTRRCGVPRIRNFTKIREVEERNSYIPRRTLTKNICL